jgi:beta-lactamase superfamily II metal-dependent hydrolase
MAARRKSTSRKKVTKKNTRIHLSAPLFIILLILAAGVIYSTYLELRPNGAVATGADNAVTTSAATTTAGSPTAGANSNANPTKSDKLTEASADGLSVYFLDVGQGDSELIVADGRAMLIDAGEPQYGDTVVSDIQKLGITKLDYIIATHPHSDHIGGLPDVMKNFDVDKIIAPKLPDKQVPTTTVYKNFIDEAKKKGYKLTQAKAGDVYDLGDAVFTILSPDPGATYDDLNDYSVVIRLVYGKTSWLFTGDAEKPAENAILKSGRTVSADILKVGHHGSANSSTADFLKAVKPQAAVIEVGAGNTYGLPTDAALKRIKVYTSKIYRTDEDGIVVFTSDGQKIVHVNN